MTDIQILRTPALAPRVDEIRLLDVSALFAFLEIELESC
jgi:hypothetical protein